MKAKSLTTLLSLLLFLFSCQNQGTRKNVDQDIGSLPYSERMAVSIMKSYPELWKSEDADKPVWRYTNGLVGLSFLKLWENTGKDTYYEYAREYADTLIDNNGIIRGYKMEDFNIDKVNSGKILFTLYEKTGDERYKIAIDTLRAQLEKQPRTNSGGFWHKKRYPYQMWLDGLYMGGPFYAQYAITFDEPESLDDVAFQLLHVEEKTMDPKTGLLRHAWNENKEQKWADPETGQASHVWGRAMGWYFMALVDVLDYFPKDHAKQPEIVAIINRLVEAVFKYQDEKTGLWYQVIDMADREGNYIEGSVSSMFAYGLLKSVKNGYIDSSYLEKSKAVYENILEHLIVTNEDGTIRITPVCAVAGLGGDPYRDGSYEYYINEAQRDNDPKATGPFIMASILYEEME